LPNRTLGLLRADLERAIAVEDRIEIERIREQIQSSGRLDGENLLYIDVEIKAGLGEWLEIAEDRDLIFKLSGLKLPVRVLSDLHEALYRRYVEPSEIIGDPKKALDAFVEARLHQKALIFGTRRGVKNPRVLKSYFLYSIANNSTHGDVFEELITLIKGLDDPFSACLLELAPNESQTILQDSRKDDHFRKLSEADEAFENLEHEKAFNIYLNSSISTHNVSRLLQCLPHLGEVEFSSKIIEYVNNWDQLQALPLQHQKRLQELTALQGKRKAHHTKSWLDWCRFVDEGADADEAIEALRNGVSTWDDRELQRDMGKITEFVQIIDNADEKKDAIFREAAPLIFGRLSTDDNLISRNLKPLFLLLITKISLFGDPSVNELGLILELVRIVFTCGLNEKEYEGLITDLEDLIHGQYAPNRFSWIVDTFDLLANNPCPSRDRLLQLGVRIVQEGGKLAHRLPPEDKVLFASICKDYELELPADIAESTVAEVTPQLESLRGRKLAIYSLDSSAAERAATFLKESCETLEIEINSDHTCTKTLSHLSKTADVFVFAWKCSKHQAYYCIKKHRDRSNPIVQPSGKGASSIIRAVLEVAA